MQNTVTAVHRILHIKHGQMASYRIGPLLFNRHWQQSIKTNGRLVKSCAATGSVRYNCNYSFHVASNAPQSDKLRVVDPREDKVPVFQPKRAVILTKMTRYEYEIQQY